MDNRILAAWEEGSVQAMVQMNPYLLQVGRRRWRMDYLVGVATRKAKRHQGYMRRLLERMMADMREEQMPFCYLMPADEAIYRPFGFTYIFRQPQWRLADETGIVRRPLSGPADTAGKRGYVEWLADWMNRWLERRYQVFAVRDAAYLLRLQEELASEDGTLDVLYDNDAMIGVQAVWGRDEREQRLLYCEAPYVQEAGEPKPAIMARIITPEQFVRAVHLMRQAAEQELTLRLFLEDPLLEANQGVWLWHLDRETSWLEREDPRQGHVVSHLKRADDTDNTLHGLESARSGVDLVLTITELTAWLFGYEVPEAAKPYEGVVETLKHVFLDEVV